MSKETEEPEKVVEETIKIRKVSCMDTIHFRWPRGRGRLNTIRGVKLCFENVSFEAHPDRLYVDLPNAALEFLRGVRAFDLDLAPKSPSELRKMAESIVANRIAAWRKTRTKADKWAANRIGARYYIGADAPQAKQLAAVLKDLRWQQSRQRAVLRNKRRLEWENSKEGRSAMFEADIKRRRKINSRLPQRKKQ